MADHLARIELRLPLALKEDLVVMARTNHLSVGAYLRTLILAEITKTHARILRVTEKRRTSKS